MNIQYRIFNSWGDLDNYPQASNFLCYQVRDKILALNYSDMRKLFMRGSKSQIIEDNAKLTMGLAEHLNNGLTAGVIEI